jgi:hypothetical protein
LPALKRLKPGAERQGIEAPGKINAAIEYAIEAREKGKPARP